MKAARIGALRHRLTLEGPVRTSDGGGGWTLSWVPLADVWADIRPSSGNETVLAEQVSGRISHEIIIRRRDGLVPAMRFRLEDRFFSLVAILGFEDRHHLLRCLCREELL